MAKLGIAIACVLCTSCLPPAPDSRHPDATLAPAPIGISVVDGLGSEHTRDDTPRRATFAIRVAVDPSDAATFPVLFRGELDAELEADAARAPWSRSALERVVAAHVEVAGDGARLTPNDPLDLGARYVLVIPAWSHAPSTSASGVTTSFDIRVPWTRAGAILVETFPPLGSVGVPRDLEAIDLRFDDEVVATAVPLVDASGAIVACDAVAVACDSVGLGEGSCVRLLPRTRLSATTTFHVDLTHVRDRFDDVPAEIETWFSTADLETASIPIAVTPPCAVDEVSLAGGCLLAQDDTLSFRIRTSDPSRISVRFGNVETHSLTHAGDSDARVSGLLPRTTYATVVELRSLSGTTSVVATSATTTAVLPHILIDEVRADAIGAEPDQEYVELWNASDVSVDVGGFRISDAIDRVGDLIPTPSIIPPRARVLVVADTFDPSDPADVQPAPGVPLLRIGGSIGTSGLTNGGEPLVLRNSSNVRVTEMPAVAAPSPGRCVVRITPFSRRSGPLDYAPSPMGGCSPGTATP